jgi:hypothetical protein
MPRSLGLVESAQSLAIPGDRLRQQQWPYPWVYPPPGAEDRAPSSIVTAPTNSTLTELLAFTVPDGMFFALRGFLLTYIGIPINDAALLVTWNIDVDLPTTFGGTLTAPVLPSGYRIPSYGFIQTHLGSLDEGAWHLEGPRIIDPRATIRVKVTTLAPFTVGLPCSFVTRLVGWLWPEERG